MNKDNSWICLFRSMLEWEWYGNHITKEVFLHCLLKANWTEGKFQGEVVPAGSFITSVNQLSKELNLSNRQVRTALTHLKSTNEITIKTTSRYTHIYLNNWDLYQSKTTSQSTNYRQSNDKRPTNDRQQYNNNNNKNKETKKENISGFSYENISIDPFPDVTDEDYD